MVRPYLTLWKEQDLQEVRDAIQTVTSHGFGTYGVVGSSFGVLSRLFILDSCLVRSKNGKWGSLWVVYANVFRFYELLAVRCGMDPKNLSNYHVKAGRSKDTMGGLRSLESTKCDTKDRIRFLIHARSQSNVDDGYDGEYDVSLRIAGATGTKANCDLTYVKNGVCGSFVARRRKYCSTQSIVRSRKL